MRCRANPNRHLLPLAIAVGLMVTGPAESALADETPVRLIEVLVGAQGHDAMALFEPTWADIRALPRCVPERAAADDPLVELDLEVAPDGAVSDLTLNPHNTTLDDSAILTCIRERMIALPFLAHGADDAVSARIIMRFATRSGMPLFATITMPEPAPDPPPRTRDDQADPDQQDRTAEPSGILASLFAQESDGAASDLFGPVGRAEAIGADGAFSGGRGFGAIDTGGTAGRASAFRPERQPVRVTESAIDVDGDLDDAIVRRTVRRNQRSILHCVETAIPDAPDGPASGAISISFVVTENGTVEDAAVEEITGLDALDQDAMRDCITARVHRWRFDATGDRRARVIQHLRVEQDGPP